MRILSKPSFNCVPHIIAVLRAGAQRAGFLAAIAMADAIPARSGEDASAWTRASQASVRLVAGGKGAGGSLRAGVELKLAQGYKTYWRSPGDSGIPPRFDWTGSTNLASIEVRWPVPARFRDGGGWSVGYSRDVLFPLAVTPRDPEKPVNLMLKLDFAICEKLCIPVQASTALTIGGGASAHSTRIAAAMALVPLRVAMGADAARVAVLDARTTLQDGRPRLDVTIAVPEGSYLLDMLVEGPDMWVFGPSTLSDQGQGRWLVSALVEDSPKGQGGPTPLVLTLITGGPASEIALDLDIPARTP